MSNESSPETSIRAIFDKAESLRLSLETQPNPNSPVYQQTLLSSLQKYEECKKLINQASLFSMNESLEDLATSDMRYLATDFNLGELILKASSKNRKGSLEVARSHYKSFIDLCEAYELLTADERKAANAASSANINTSYLPTDPGSRRAAKIAQFKREKELRARVEALSATIDDEDVRSFYKASISLAVVQTVQSLEMIKLELDILAQAPPKSGVEEEVPGESDRRAPGMKNMEYSEKLDVIGGPIQGGALLSKDGKPLRPFTILGRREQLKEGVFKPSHSLPTMTIDEYLEEERARGGIIEGGGEKSGIIPELNQDDEEAVNAAMYKARAWDEYTEANPKGAGNTLNRG